MRVLYNLYDKLYNKVYDKFKNPICVKTCIYTHKPPLALANPFEWDTAVQVVQENNRQRVLFDSKFKYIREMIVSTNAHDEDEVNYSSST